MGAMESRVENYVLDRYWIHQYLKQSGDWYDFLAQLGEVSPFFHLNLLSFTAAWAEVYPFATAEERKWLINEVFTPVAGLAELESRSIVEEGSVATARNRRIILVSDSDNLLHEVMCSVHAGPKPLSDSAALEEIEAYWVYSTYCFLSTADSPAILLVRSVDPYLEHQSNVRYHPFSD